mgnify:CR=1 FL=1|tara:strand:- start:620 stop:1051 length:432 start_codon:yes stop_codon:yes gene_type:complete
MDKIKIIKKMLVEHRIIYLKNNKIVLYGISKTNAKQLIINKYHNSKTPINLTRLVISFHKGVKFYQGGPIQLNFKQYTMFENKLSLRYEYGTSGSIWITKRFLIKDLFKNKKKILNLIITLCKRVNINKNIKIPGVNLITNFI